MEVATDIPLASQDSTPNQQHINPLEMVFKVVKLLAMLYVFLVGIGIIGDSFNLLGGSTAGELFQAVNHPIAGLMVGMVATALLQSSSTTTSIIVGMVAGGAVNIGAAIPMIMGANIGTSVTNTLVSMGHAGNREEFRRAFAGATVHDFFNILAVAVLLPLEIAFGFLEKTSAWLTTLLVDTGGASFDSPLKTLIKPVVGLFVSIDKSKIKAAAAGTPVDGSLLKGGMFHGMDLSDSVVGTILLIMGIGMTILALLGIVKIMRSLMEAKATDLIKRSLEFNPYTSMGIGAGATVMVQSSSITTSTMVPMVGVGLVSLEAIFPLTLGANVGTTVTALLASMGATGEHAALGLQIALCHLLFNVVGILIWYPIPLMRDVPLKMARKLGELVSRRRSLALAYIALVFFILPLAILGVDKAIGS